MKTTQFWFIYFALAWTLAACSLAPATQPPANTLPAATETPAADLSAIEPDLQLAGYSTTTGALAWQQGDPITLLADSPSTNVFASLAEPNPTVSNFILGVDIQWESGEDGLNGCDIIFRSDPDLETGRQLLFETIRFSGIYPPNWGFYLISQGIIEQDLSGGAQYSPDIDQTNGNSNHYLLLVNNQEVSLFANGALVFQDTLNTDRVDGVIGIDAWQNLGPVTTCTFSNAWVWELP